MTTVEQRTISVNQTLKTKGLRVAAAVSLSLRHDTQQHFIPLRKQGATALQAILHEHPLT
jgi:hypothetical protein